MKISIIGTGYVGLTTGISMAELGNRVVLVDVITEKLILIEEGRSPFYEPDVDELLRKHVESGRITTSMDTRASVLSSDITFITVGTPSKEDGSMDDRYIMAACRDIGEALSTHPRYHVVVVKSTVVPGTTAGPVKTTLEKSSGRRAGADFGIAMCPEFLREGAAMHDSMKPDRIVIGCEDIRTYDVLYSLFRPLSSPILKTDPTSAEMIKYASNSLLATKISFANEISRICEKVGVDVYGVMKGVGMDFRISPHFLRAGAGFGGSCFPKDVSALIQIARSLGVDTPILESVMMNNMIQPIHLVDVAEKVMGSFQGKRIAVLGLAFKPDTDDVRSTRSEPLIRELLKRGAIVSAHDPKAAENFRREIPEIEYFIDANAAVDWAEGVFIMTEWPEYRKIDWNSKTHLEGVFDGRRSVDPASMKNLIYWSIGNPLP
ncbi:MAG: UDP-glucose dehydrogenase family protein [Thermoplasmatota archaeon]